MELKYLMKRRGNAGFALVASKANSRYVDNRPLLMAGKPETWKNKTSCRPIVLLSIFFATTLVLYSQQAVVSTNQDLHYSQFKEFLSGKRPSMAYVKGARSSLLYFNNGKPWTTDVEYVASLQPNTYYVKQLGTSYDPDTNKFTIAGASYLEKWYINEYGQVTIASRNPTISGTNTPVGQVVDDRRILIDEILNMGIFSLNSQSVLWTNDNFEAELTIPDQLVTISGHITGSNALRPDYLEYRSSNLKDTAYKVTFEYNDDGKRPSWMPYKTILVMSSLRQDAKAGPRFYTNTIEQLVMGLTNVGEFGYVYRDFLPKEVSITNRNLVVYSNGIGYVLAGNVYEKVVQSPTAPVLNSKEKLKVVRIFFCFFLLLSFITFWRLATRCRQENKPEKNK
jgi:hypothetical protein